MQKDDKMPSEGKLEDKMAQESNNKDSSSIENNVLDTASPIGASEKKKDDGERTNPKTVMAAPAELSMASSEEESVAELGRVETVEEGACSDRDKTGSSIQNEDDHGKPSMISSSTNHLAESPKEHRDNESTTHPNSDVHSSAGMSSAHQHYTTHKPTSLPTFNEPRSCMWTSSHAANAPSEDRSASLVNVLLQPLPHTNFDSETQIHDNFNDGEYPSLIRLNLWSVIDGHGGGCVATYASEVLLPHIAASISRAMGCAIVSRGVCLVNGQLRDANALDLDGLIKTTGSDRSQSNPNSIHYRSPYEATANMSTTDFSEKEDDDIDHDHVNKPKVVEVKQRKRKSQEDDVHHPDTPELPSPASTTPSQQASPSPRTRLRQSSTDDTTRADISSSINRSESSVKTSVKTSASVGVARDGAPAGTHSPQEQAAIIRAITQSFLSVDEGWINSIDPIATHQTSCQSNGRWNSGACALTVMSVQRLEWTSVSSSPERGNNGDYGEFDYASCLAGDGGDGGHDTSQNKDAARRRRIDHNENRALKSASSLSTISSTSSLTTTVDRIHHNASGLESEITETEGEEDDHNGRDGGDKSKRWRNNPEQWNRNDDANIPKESLISAPGGCSCHCYRAYDAMLYTAHVGDCRAVMLGSAPPRTINVRGSTKSGTTTSASPSTNPGNQTDDESSHHSSDETECLSSSDHDADSSDDEDMMSHHLDGATAVTKSTTSTSNTSGASAPYATLMSGRKPARPRRQSRRRRYDDLGMAAPYIALPPLETFRSIEIEIDPDYDKKRRRRRRRPNRKSSGKGNSNSSNNNNNNDTMNSGKNADESGNNGDQSEASSSSSSSPSSQDSREFPPAIILPPNTRPIDLTTDHSAYNPAEVTAVLRRCNNAPRAISAGLGGGIKRVAGSLAVTRALGDAYLKTPRLSFFPYKTHTPYITARPEVNCRPIVKGGDKVLMLATDGVWERAGGEDVLRWARTFYSERLAEAERRKNLGRLNKMENQHLNRHSSSDEGDMTLDNTSNATATNNTVCDETSVDSRGDNRATETKKMGTTVADIAIATTAATAEAAASNTKKRDALSSPPGANAGKRRKLRSSTRRATPFGSRRNSTVADVIVRRVLNKVRRARNISSLHALMSLPPGRARRSKHDDITVCLV
eukprot:CAMPEP_0116149268 /NCGR_PEP_ID=MMETSP0329-20121206/18835_1 /TAXON_ID=697910 /ORGANISM="Pseudo-nitzschia arenysensis, Strain B593" /LENGTH=1154 /DNA_ID=CAMNT_0003645527 /DNA_START=148 /DNA_END=3609 /DNA_ORIENTATION=-